MNLPTIHPLHEGEPLGRGPDGECLCNFCRHWWPLLQHVQAQLDAKGRKLLEEYTEYAEQRIEDGNVDRARLEGNWLGWETLKGFSPQTHKMVEMTEAEKARWSEEQGL